MRQIGHLPSEASARTFRDYLYVQGIENQIDHEPAEGWAIWIADEDKLERASALLRAFQQSPTDPKFQAQAKSAAELRTAAAKEETAYRKKVRSRRQLFGSLSTYGFGPLTFALILASVVVAILSKMGNDPRPIMGLFISSFTFGFDPNLTEVRHGEIWRLITPIFIHFGPLHILFNMLWLRDLGSMIEARQSTLHLAALVVVLAATSNLGQFYMTQSPAFGGMSGVVYGLLGYIWIRGKFDPGSGLFLHQYTVTMMLVWFFACVFGVIPHVANWAHGVGLAVGMAWGYLSSLRLR
jgi:GlpG protein